MKTADIPTPKLVIILSRAYRSLAEFLEGGLAQQGVILTDFAILEVLLHKGPLATSAIRQKIPLPETSIKRGIDRLKRRGLIRRKDDSTCQPAEMSELTDEGHKTITRI